MKVLVILFICGIFFTRGERHRGHNVLRVIPSNRNQLAHLNDLMISNHLKLDFWTEPQDVNSPVDIQVAPQWKRVIEQDLDIYNIPHEVIIKDVQSLVDAERVQHYANKKDDFNWTRYHNLAEIYTWLDETAASCGDDCEVLDIGQSYEGRDIRVIKISRPGENRKSAWIDGTVHAREWISPAVTTYIINQLITGYGVDETTTRIRDAFDWHILTVVNPDGYAYTWEQDRMWRKTRSPNVGSSCMGTDGNRNFDYEWDAEGGASDDPCSQIYRGAFAASEVEMQIQSKYMSEIQENLELSLTLHSYSQEVIIPWGYTHDPPEDFDEMNEVAIIIRDAIFSVHGVEYVAKMPTGMLSGNTMDFAKGALGVKWSYLMELRDTGEHGFLLPTEQILPNAEEMWAGVQAFALEISQRA